MENQFRIKDNTPRTLLVKDLVIHTTSIFMSTYQGSTPSNGRISFTSTPDDLAQTSTSATQNTNDIVQRTSPLPSSVVTSSLETKGEDNLITKLTNDSNL